jgi:hypothetical protein
VVERSSKSLDLLKSALATASRELLDKSITQDRAAPIALDATKPSRAGVKDLRTSTETVVDYSKDRLSTDVQLAAQKALGSLKDDAEEQLRIGTWAVHVLAARMEATPSEILSGMKKDALLALGRLSMQLLAASAKEARAEFEAKASRSLNSSRGTGKQASLLNAGTQHRESSQGPELLQVQQSREDFGDLQKSAIKGANDFFRLEAVHGDLQALQNNIKLDFTADMMVEGFIEALRNDDLDAQRDLRTDILSQFQAAQVPRQNSREEVVSARSSKISFSTSASFHGATKQAENLAAPRESSELRVEVKGQRQEVMDSDTEVVMEYEEAVHQEGGAWTKPPSSKYIE